MNNKSLARWPWGRVALFALVVAVLVALLFVAGRQFDLPAFLVPDKEADVSEAVVNEPVIARPLVGGGELPPLPVCAGQFAFQSGDYAKAYGALVVQSADDPSAAFLLGRMFSEGLAVPQNEDAAKRAFRSAAERGHRDAASALALLYQGGKRADFVQALHWYEQAALLGDGNAQQTVAQMYASGTGTQADPVRAAAWLDVINDRHLSEGTAMSPDLLHLRRQLNDAGKNNNAIAAASAELRQRLDVARATFPGENYPCDP